MLETICRPLLLLLLAIVVSLTHRFEIVLIPEKNRVTTMRYLMVSHGAVGCRIGADAQHSCLLACVQVPQPNLLAKTLPAFKAIPCSPCNVIVSLFLASLFITGHMTEPRRQAADP